MHFRFSCHYESLLIDANTSVPQGYQLRKLEVSIDFLLEYASIKRLNELLLILLKERLYAYEFCILEFQNMTTNFIVKKIKKLKNIILTSSILVSK